MSSTKDLMTGIAQLLTARNVGVYDVTRVWTAADTQTVITFKDLPPVPDRVLALTPRDPVDHPSLPMGTRRIQLRGRGTSDPNDVDDILDAAFDVLHGATDLTFGSVHVVQILRISSIPMGMDEQDRRWQRSDNYDVDLDYPTTPNRPF